MGWAEFNGEPAKLKNILKRKMSLQGRAKYRNG
jgi:hypothetical protein